MEKSKSPACSCLSCSDPYISGTAITAPDPHVASSNRKIRQRATILDFIAENRLPTSIAPKLGGLCKALSKDTTALHRVQMSSTAAVYKLRDGLSQHWQEDLAKILRVAI